MTSQSTMTKSKKSSGSSPVVSKPMDFKLDNNMTINDWTFLKVVGRGSTKSMMIHKNDNVELICSLRVLKKKELVKNDKELRIRELLSNLNHPFIASLRYSFQSDTKLYVIYDFFNAQGM